MLLKIVKKKNADSEINKEKTRILQNDETICQDLFSLHRLSAHEYINWLHFMLSQFQLSCTAYKS